jgi:hypothetical protein
MLLIKALTIFGILILCACAPQALIPPVASVTPTLTASAPNDRNKRAFTNPNPNVNTNRHTHPNRSAGFPHRQR